MDNFAMLFALLVVAAIFVVRGNEEGWRPFAWYGAPPGTAQAGGDWKGIVSATTEVVIPPAAPAPVPVKKRGKL